MIKNIIKKVGWLALACLLLAQVMLPVMAQPNLNGIDPNALGSIRIHRFAGSTATSPTSGTPLNGIPYTVTRVRLRDDVVATTPDDLRDPDNFVPVAGAEAHSATASTVAGIATFANLPQGIYLVTEGAHTITPESDRVQPFIVGIPRRALNENDEYTWVYDVDVYPKSDEDLPVVFDKELDLVWDEELGEMVAQWTLETTVPRLIGNATRFEFIDELDERFTFIYGSVVGTFLRMEEVDGTPTPVTETMPNNMFQVNVDANNVLSIALTQIGFDLLSTHAILAPEGTLTFTFRTSLSMAEEDLGPITNQARLYYNEEDHIETETSPPVEYLFAIEIEKIDVNGDRLSEATFEMFLDTDEAYPAFPDVNGINTTFTTTDGIVFIPGLPTGTFYLRETVAPAGYRPNTGWMPIVVGEGYTAYPERPFVVTLQVVNEVEGGFILPETGGTGTLIFTVIGLALVGGALSLVLVAKRRREMND